MQVAKYKEDFVNDLENYQFFQKKVNYKVIQLEILYQIMIMVFSSYLDQAVTGALIHDPPFAMYITHHYMHTRVTIFLCVSVVVCKVRRERGILQQRAGGSSAQIELDTFEKIV